MPSKLPFLGSVKVRIPSGRSYAGEEAESASHEAAENSLWEAVEHLQDLPVVGSPMDRGGKGTPILGFGYHCPKRGMK